MQCQYPLEHLSSNMCPECGRSFDPTDPSTFASGPPSVRGLFVVTIFIASLLLPVIVLSWWLGKAFWLW